MMRSVLRLSSLAVCLVLSTVVCASGTGNGQPKSNGVKRITVNETNNFRLDKRFITLQMPTQADDPILVELAAYVRRHTVQRNGNGNGNGNRNGNSKEFDEILRLTHWVHQRWEHTAIGSAPPQATALDILRWAEVGGRYSCTEYSKVLRDVLHSHGIPARIVSLQNSDADYGGLGSAHVAVEAWSNVHNKWFLLDAQFGLFAQHQNVPVNVVEIFQLLHADRFAEVIFRPVANNAVPAALAAELQREYQTFIGAYFGFMSTNYNLDGERLNVVLPLQGQSWPLTLQGLVRNNRVFARDVRDVYFNLNQTAILLRFRAEAQPPKTAFEFKDEQDYLIKMPQFAAVPDFDVALQHNMPWFSHYEYAVDRRAWAKLTTSTFRWTLHAGDNHLAVRAVNAFGKKGPATFYSIRYQ